MLVQEGYRSILEMNFIQMVLLTTLLSISDGKDAVLLVSFDFPFPQKILIVSYSTGDANEKWADFAWCLGRERLLKDALAFVSDSSCGIQFKFTVAGRKSVNAEVPKVFVNTLLC